MKMKMKMKMKKKTEHETEDQHEQHEHEHENESEHDFPERMKRMTTCAVLGLLATSFFRIRNASKQQQQPQRRDYFIRIV